MNAISQIPDKILDRLTFKPMSNNSNLHFEKVIFEFSRYGHLKSNLDLNGFLRCNFKLNFGIIRDEFERTYETLCVKY